MASFNELGKRGEQAAAFFLEEKGYRIVERNWRFEKYEIDLIVQNEDTLAIIEVKTRGSDLFENPEEAVHMKKRKNLILAADRYVESNDLDVEVRFDILAIQAKGDDWEIKHIEDAFNAF